jgi:hypothetical protein
LVSPDETSCINHTAYPARILSALGLNVRNKAERYGENISLKAFFLLNNINYIRRSLTEYVGAALNIR